jgi:predicted Zn-dependent protease
VGLGNHADLILVRGGSLWEAAVVLGAVAKGDDPLEGARVAGQAAKSDIASKTQTIRIGHLSAAHTRIHADGKIMIDLTWIAHRGFVYQIAGLASTQRSEALESTFAAVAQSLRPLSQAERSGIKEERIRLVKNLTKYGWTLTGWDVSSAIN